jgi:hypothetical protein
MLSDAALSRPTNVFEGDAALDFFKGHIHIFTFFHFHIFFRCFLTTFCDALGLAAFLNTFSRFDDFYYIFRNKFGCSLTAYIFTFCWCFLTKFKQYFLIYSLRKFLTKFSRHFLKLYKAFWPLFHNIFCCFLTYFSLYCFALFYLSFTIPLLIFDSVTKLQNQP